MPTRASHNGDDNHEAIALPALANAADVQDIENNSNADGVEGGKRSSIFGGRDLLSEKLPEAWVERLPLLSSLPLSVAVYGVAIVIAVIYVSIAAAIFLYLQPDVIGIANDNNMNPLDGQEFNASGNSTVRMDEHNFLTAFYYAIVTLSTVGYGDISPQNDGTRIFASLYILLSVVLVGVGMDLIDTVMTTESDLNKLAADEEDAGKAHMNQVQLLGCLWVPRSKYKLVLRAAVVLVMILLGVLFFTLAEEFTVGEAFYFSVVTLTTVGYGDLKPRTENGRLFAIFWIAIGCLSFFQMLGEFMDLLMEKRRRQIHQQIKVRRARARERLQRMYRAHAEDDKRRGKQYGKQRGAAPERVSQRLADMEDAPKSVLQSALSEAEFILYNLQRSGRVTEDEVYALVKLFKEQLALDSHEAIDLDSLSFHLSSSTRSNR